MQDDPTQALALLNGALLAGLRWPLALADLHPDARTQRIQLRLDSRVIALTQTTVAIVMHTRLSLADRLQRAR